MWGYSDTYSEAVTEADVVAGNEAIVFSAVPAGEVWVVTAFIFWSDQANAAFLQLIAHIGPADIIVDIDATVTAREPLKLSGSLVLAEGDYLKVYYQGASAGDDFFGRACGYKMKVT